MQSSSHVRSCKTLLQGVCVSARATRAPARELCATRTGAQIAVCARRFEYCRPARAELVELFAGRGGADMFAEDFEGRTAGQRAAERSATLRAETVERRPMPRGGKARHARCSEHTFITRDVP